MQEAQPPNRPMARSRACECATATQQPSGGGPARRSLPMRAPAGGNGPRPTSAPTWAGHGPISADRPWPSDRIRRPSALLADQNHLPTASPGNPNIQSFSSLSLSCRAAAATGGSPEERGGAAACLLCRACAPTAREARSCAAPPNFFPFSSISLSRNEKGGRPWRLAEGGGWRRHRPLRRRARSPLRGCAAVERPVGGALCPEYAHAEAVPHRRTGDSG